MVPDAAYFRLTYKYNDLPLPTNACGELPYRAACAPLPAAPLKTQKAVDNSERRAVTFLASNENYSLIIALNRGYQ